MLTGVGDVLAVIGDKLVAAGEYIWSYPIDWEPLVHVIGFGVLIVGGWFLLRLLWPALLRLGNILLDLVEIAWLLIRRRMRRGH